MRDFRGKAQRLFQKKSSREPGESTKWRWLFLRWHSRLWQRRRPVEVLSNGMKKMTKMTKSFVLFRRGRFIFFPFTTDWTICFGGEGLSKTHETFRESPTPAEGRISPLPSSPTSKGRKQLIFFEEDWNHQLTPTLISNDSGFWADLLVSSETDKKEQREREEDWWNRR